MKPFLFLILISVLFGCAHVISKETRTQVDSKLESEALFKTPETYRGKMVILGGIIISGKNTEEETHIEVLQIPLDWRGHPKYTDDSYGRFIILHEGFLDTEVYSKGREITVAGEVLGKKLRRLDNMEYPYLLIKSKEIHLIRRPRRIPLSFFFEISGTF